MPRRSALAATLITGLFLLGCTQPLPGGTPGGLSGLDHLTLPATPAAGTPAPVKTAPPREILPFRAGDHFAFDIRYLMLNGLLGLPVGVLSLDVQNVSYEGGVETIDLTLSAAGSTEAHRIVLKDGMFHYDDKPFVPDHMRPGLSWLAQDGIAQVADMEPVDVPADYYPYCYPVVFTIQKTNERLLLWFAPGIGLVKGNFKLNAFGEGRIELKQRPTNLKLGLKYPVNLG